MNRLPQVQKARRIGRKILPGKGYLAADAQQSHKTADKTEIELGKQMRPGIQNGENIILVILEESGGPVRRYYGPFMLLKPGLGIIYDCPAYLFGTEGQRDRYGQRQNTVAGIDPATVSVSLLDV